MALTTQWGKSKWSLIFERPNRKREEEEEEEKKKRREEEGEKFKQAKVWNFVYICMDTCLWVVGCEKPNPKMNSYMEIITNPFDLSRVLL